MTMSLPDALISGSQFPEQDYVVMNGIQTPGRAIVKGASTPRKWDKRDGYGCVGPAVWYVGESLAEFTVEVSLWLPDHFRDWNSFAKSVLSRGPENSSAEEIIGAPGLTRKVPKKVTISHPLLNLPPFQIKEVVVTDVSQFDVDDYGLYTCTIKLLEYKPRKQIAVAKPDPVPDTPVLKPPPAKTKNEIAIEQAQAAVLAERAKLNP